MTAPTARDPWTVTLAWTPDQNHGAVAVFPSRSPLFAVLGALTAGDTPAGVAAEFGLTEQEATVLSYLVDDLRGVWA